MLKGSYPKKFEEHAKAFTLHRFHKIHTESKTEKITWSTFLSGVPAVSGKIVSNFILKYIKYELYQIVSKTGAIKAFYP